MALFEYFANYIWTLSVAMALVVRAGDVVIQRGTNHGWANRSGKSCRIAFIRIDGRNEGGLAQ